MLSTYETLFCPQHPFSSRKGFLLPASAFSVHRSPSLSEGSRLIVVVMPSQPQPKDIKSRILKYFILYSLHCFRIIVIFIFTVFVLVCY